MIKQTILTIGVRIFAFIAKLKFYFKQKGETKFYTDYYLKKIKLKGNGIKFNGQVVITNPRYLNIGNNVHIGENAYLDTRGGITIGDNSHISRNLVIYTSNHDFRGEIVPYSHDIIPRSVVIKENVWIGMNVVIVPGVTIGKGAIIGMGTVVTSDVKDFEIIGNQKHRVIGNRSEDEYYRAIKNNNISGAGGFKIPSEKIESFKRGLNQSDQDIVFILSTGRAGSTSIASALNKHPDIEAFHEPHANFMTLSAEYILGVKTRDQVKDEILAIYKSAKRFTKGKVYIESDQKLVHLLDILIELFPHAKYIWLIRNGAYFVASSYARGWFKEKTNLRKSYKVNPHIRSLGVRLGGYETNQCTFEEWESKSTFEKNCWYWGYWNRIIEQNLDKLSENQKLVLKLEELNDDFKNLLDFIGVSQLEIKVLKENQKLKGHNIIKSESWSESQKKVFYKHCSKYMDMFYE